MEKHLDEAIKGPISSSNFRLPYLGGLTRTILSSDKTNSYEISTPSIPSSKDPSFQLFQKNEILLLGVNSVIRERTETLSIY